MRSVITLSVLAIGWAGGALAAPQTQSSQPVAAVAGGLPRHVLDLEFGVRRLPDRPIAESLKSVLAPPAAAASCPEIKNDGHTHDGVRGAGRAGSK